MILLVLVGGAGLLALFVVGKYNSLVTLRNRYRNGFSQIDIQLKRRYDLIPNLRRSQKVSQHERETSRQSFPREILCAAGAKRRPIREPA
jgi:LemA protein